MHNCCIDGIFSGLKYSYLNSPKAKERRRTNNLFPENKVQDKVAYPID